MRLSPLQAPRRTYILSCLALAVLGTGCLEEVLQTARTDNGFGGNSGGLGFGGESSLSVTCETAPTAEQVSWGAAVADENAPEGSLFATGSYGAGEGPGLSIAARDAFRVYLNGNLVSESENPRAALFVPLSLPPGDNMLAIAIAAQEGMPAALLHLAELERDYTSDDTWKVSSTPSQGWTSVDYDDSSWPAAQELADFGDLPGCDPKVDFPRSSTARWISPTAGTEGPIMLRKRIRIAPVGFAEGTTGGGARAPVVVSTWEELELAVNTDAPTVVLLQEGNYDFRLTGAGVVDQEVCPTECPDDPSMERYQVLLGTDTCPNPLITVQRNDRILSLGSNKTIVGLGRGASVRGVTFDFQGSENLIVRNVALYDINPHILEAGDAFSLQEPQRVWIDHGTVKWVSDGFTDMREGTSNVTLSYMHYDGEDDAVCGGRHAWTSSITDTTVTIHHSRYDHARTRAPLVVGASSRAHLFNNVFSNTSGWTVGASCLAQMLLEGNTFENVDAATYRSGCDGVAELGLIQTSPGSNLYRDDSNVHLGDDGSEPTDSVFAPPYDYGLETASEAWPAVISRAGTGGPWAIPLTRD